MKLERPDKAPIIDMVCVKAKHINLSDYKGKKILLSFFRDTVCPFTNIWLDGLMQNESFYEKHNLAVIGVFNDSPIKVINSIKSRSLAFPIIADETLDVYSEYGIETSKYGRAKSFLKFRNIKKLISYRGSKGLSKSSILPAEFLIDEQGLIYTAHYGTDYADHIRTKDIIKWIKK
ncbi:MAG: peroxiredoxin Q/BCP [Flavobacteriales bacterium]|jgi:peroxiredoxin Q/BCP